MTDEETDEREPRVEPSPSDEWIDKIAQSEGIDHEEVVERLISSYWTLKEMHGLLEQTGSDIELDAEEWPPSFEGLISEAVAESLGDLQERLSELETGAPEAAGASPTEDLDERLSAIEDRIAHVEETLGEEHDGLESRVDEEFENLETVLDYLIETTDDLEAGLGSVSDVQEADRRWRAKQEQLTEIKELASRLGVSTAKCEYCNAAIDISLLPTPECPQCDRRFTDIDPDKRWFGLGTSRLRVTDQPYLGDEAESDD